MARSLSTAFGGDWDDYWRLHLENEHARNYPNPKAA